MISKSISTNFPIFEFAVFAISSGILLAMVLLSLTIVAAILGRILPAL